MNGEGTPDRSREPGPADGTGQQPGEHSFVSAPSGRGLRRILLPLSFGVAIVVCLFAGLGTVSLLGMLHVERRFTTPPEATLAVEIVASDQAILKGSWWPAGQIDGEWKQASAGAPTELQPMRCVLILHGLRDSRRGGLRYAPVFTGAGYSVLTPDSRGHGESGGEMITYGLVEKYDAMAWVSWMRERGCEKIYGLGFSLGASVLIEAAALTGGDSISGGDTTAIQSAGVFPSEIRAAGERVPPSRPFEAIVADSPFADLLEIAEYRARLVIPFPEPLRTPTAKLALLGGQFYTRFMLGLDFRQASAVHSIVRTDTPVLLIHGLRDNRTPPSHSEELAAASPATTELWLVPGARHIRSSEVAPEEFEARVLGWFEDH